MPAPIRVVVQQMALPHYRVPVFRELARRSGIDLRVIYGSVPGLSSVEPDGFAATRHPVHSLMRAGREVLRWQPGSVREASMQDYDVMVLDANLRHLSLFPTAARVAQSGRGVVLWGHGLRAGVGWWGRRYWRLLLARTDAMLLYAEQARPALESLDFPAHRTFVARNTLDLSDIRAARTMWTAARAREFARAHGLADSRVVLFVARLSAERRLDVLLEAARRLARPEVVLVVVGDGPARSQLEALAERLELGTRVRFLGAEYDEVRLAAWYSLADVVCLPACVGLSLVHAFGHGAAVIAGASGSGPEIGYLQDGINGLRLEQPSASDLADRLARLLDDNPLRLELGRRAQQTAERDCSLGAMVDQMEAAIRFAVRRRGAEPS